MPSVAAIKRLPDIASRYLRRSAFIFTPSAWGETALLRARFNDAVFVSPSRRYLFASNEKVANSTMRVTLQTLEGDGVLPPYYDHFKRWTGPLRQPSDFKDFGAVLKDPEIYKFCVTRHPYARLISCFRNKLEPSARGRGFPKMMRQLGLDQHGDLRFDNFVEAIARQDQIDMNPHWRPQFYNVFMDRINYDEVIPYEEFAPRMTELVERFYPEAKGQALSSANRQPTNSDALVNEYFSPTTKKMAQKIYAIDFEKFGYTP